MLQTKQLFLSLAICLFGLSAAAQTPTYDELTFEADSTGASYKPSGKNFVVVKSKRGTSGLNKTPQADAILTSEVTEIVLVYTETDAAAIGEREEANRERWENLLMTYPELFQYSTTYKNVCQCNIGGDAEALKKTQGFYVYVNGPVPKAEEPKAETPPPPPPAPVAKTEEPAKPKAENKKPVEEKKSAPVASSEPPAAPKTAPPVEEKKPEVKEEPVTSTSSVETEESHAAEPAKAAPKKKVPAAAKGRRAKDPKACRPACYEGGDEDLVAYYKSSIKLTKKQKKKLKKIVTNVKIQLDMEGAIKKVMVTGEKEEFNKQVEDVTKNMGSWRSAVKGGVAVKAEVKFNLKFDPDTKTMKATDITVSPKPGPKCRCASDSEIFGD